MTWIDVAMRGNVAMTIHPGGPRAALGDQFPVSPAPLSHVDHKVIRSIEGQARIVCDALVALALRSFKTLSFCG